MDWLKKTKAKVTEKVTKHQQEAKIKKQTFKGTGYSLQDAPPAPGPSAAAAPPPPPKRSANVTDEERALRRAQQAAAAQRRELPAPKKRTTFSTEKDDDDDEEDAVRSEAFEAAKMLEQLKIAESGFNPYQATISSSTEARGVSVGATEAKPSASPPKPSSPRDDELVPVATKATLVKLLENILSNPDDVKYQKLRLSNAQIQAKIASVPLAMDLLEHAGFDRVVLDDGEDYLVLNATRTSAEILQRTLETLGQTS
ncbi:hypothetical protein SDRG_12532 [Saprolegnia diclina VS20]|uniref:PUB domain-containing protein n=1 Tax=Saprolegnia diclina (strain VS20) TaxID=1156394 RepID=T0Q567_SAPDV|nr:hypothetical protein SDRG_12532 [Saprolegnia diclina VS20]EQC29761.1 hypothetical protein SDRG_12532 [Saprolegnia diclina VS20]|eukprot:XP_008616827.1 hypothetical protein SDRG_12532 [Saprolegnia diclina VS20]